VFGTVNETVRGLYQGRYFQDQLYMFVICQLVCINTNRLVLFVMHRQSPKFFLKILLRLLADLGKLECEDAYLPLKWLYVIVKINIYSRRIWAVCLKNSLSSVLIEKSF